MTGVAPTDRIFTLDVLRGVAVMGILAMNIVAFAMPFPAYTNPTAYGPESDADLVSWAFSFVFIDGKMRGLFSFLFGASALLVIERARAAGLNATRVHYARMFWLLIFGLLHFYFIWFGDILAAYAMAGLLLFFFRSCRVRTLLLWGIVLLFVQMVEYFYKSKKDPADLNDELLKNALLKNHQQYISFIRAQENMILLPIKAEVDRMSRSQRDIIERFNNEILKHNA